MIALGQRAKSTRIAAIFGLLCVVGLSVAQSRAQESIADLASFPSGSATVTTTTGQRHRFSVWIADTPERHRQGLMFVQDLPPDQGMLFVNERARPSAFWMKNTFIPLDILFFDAQGRLIGAFERRPPHSLDAVGPEGPVKWVLELRGGEAERRGIGVGAILGIPTAIRPSL